MLMNSIKNTQVAQRKRMNNQTCAKNMHRNRNKSSSIGLHLNLVKKIRQPLTYKI